MRVKRPPPGPKLIKTITLLHCHLAEEATTVTEFLLSHGALDLPLTQDRQAEHFQIVLIQFQVETCQGDIFADSSDPIRFALRRVLFQFTLLARFSSRRVKEAIRSPVTTSLARDLNILVQDAGLPQHNSPKILTTANWVYQQEQRKCLFFSKM